MRFRDYWRERAKESFVKARVIAEAAIFAALMICGLIGLWLSKLPVDKTVWWSGFIAFGGWLIIEICFISPFNHAKLLSEKIDPLEDRLTPRIKVSGDMQTENCFTIGNDIAYFRARLDSMGLGSYS